MKANYILIDAITFNPTGQKHNALASIATVKEIREHKEYFVFKFEKNIKEGATIYKITKQNDKETIQGFVSVKQKKDI